MKRAFDLWQCAIEIGNHIMSMYSLALVWEEGREGVKKNEERAAALRNKVIESKSLVYTMQIYSFMVQDGMGIFRRNIPLSVHVLKSVVQRNDVPTKVLTDLARLLLSDDVGDMRNPGEARDLLERGIKIPNCAPAIHELATLCSRGDDGMGRNSEKWRNLFKLTQVQYIFKEKLTRDFRKRFIMIQAEERIPDVVEESLKKATVLPRECFAIVFGGTGRERTSVIRSLCGMKFVSDHITTELACVDGVCVLGDGRLLREEEVEDLRFKSESLITSMSRADVVGREFIGENKMEVGKRWEEGTEMGSNGDGDIHMERGSRQRTVGNIEDVTSEVELIEKMESSSKIGTNIKGRGCDIDEKEEPKHSDVIEKTRYALTGRSFLPGNKGALLVCWDLDGQKEHLISHRLFFWPPGVKLFVIDLEKFQEMSSRQNGLSKLCHWMQMVYICSEDVTRE